MAKRSSAGEYDELNYKAVNEIRIEKFFYFISFHHKVYLIPGFQIISFYTFLLQTQAP